MDRPENRIRLDEFIAEVYADMPDPMHGFFWVKGADGEPHTCFHRLNEADIDNIRKHLDEISRLRRAHKLKLPVRSTIYSRVSDD